MQETLGHPRVALVVRMDSLEGCDTLEETVASPEDLSHAPAAQGLQKDVGADNQPFAGPVAQVTGLVGGQPSAPLQHLKEILDARKLPRDAVEVSELPGCE